MKLNSPDLYLVLYKEPNYQGLLTLNGSDIQCFDDIEENFNFSSVLIVPRDIKITPPGFDNLFEVFDLTLYNC